MKQTTTTWKWWLKCLAYLLAATIVAPGLMGVVITQASGGASDAPAWASPNAMAIKRVASQTGAQNEPAFLNNLDCSLATFRYSASGDMRTGCFASTAYGLMESDSSSVIFSGTDEAVPLISYLPHQVIAPWPGTTVLVSLDSVSTGGTRLGLYKNLTGHINDQRDLLLKITAKQLTAPPELPLRDRAGQQLIINPQTLAFSDGGAWLVAETLGGSFVRINLATLDMKAFAPAFGSQGSPGLLQSRVTITDNGRYVAIANDIATSFKVYDLSTCSGTPVNLQPENCQAYDYWPFIKRQVPGLQNIRHTRFVNDGLVSFEARGSLHDYDGIYSLAPRDSIDSLIDYLGLGDSFTSGEGAFNYQAGTDTEDNMCHLSLRSYPVLLTNDLFTSRGGHSVACSGAVINDISSSSDSYKGQVRGGLDFNHLNQNSPGLLASVLTNFVPGYLAQQRFVKQYQPAIITVSVGGDDIGFGDIVERCVMPHVTRHNSDNICFNTYEDRLELMRSIDRTIPRWTSLFMQLKKSAPSTRLYAIGYPSLAADTGNCALNVHLSKSELEFSEEIVAYLNNSIHQASKQSGIIYIDIGQALKGHRLCETASHNVAVNGLTAGKDVGLFGINVLGKESYHPNALGHQLMEQAILKQTHNLTDTPTPIPTTDNIQKLLNAPKSGRAITTRVPVSSLVSKVIKSGHATALKADGTSTGLKPSTSYSVRLDGPTGVIIGSVISDSNGSIDAAVTLPSNTSPGSHTIDLTGENQIGQPTDLTQPIYVPVSDTDSDGDNIPDSNDSCPLAINSGQDIDKDGVDDVCDSQIGLSVSSPPPNTAITAATATITAQINNPPKTSPNNTSSPAITNPPLQFSPSQKAVTVHTKQISPGIRSTIKPLPRQPFSLHTEQPTAKIHPEWKIWLLWLLICWVLLVLIIRFTEYIYERKNGVAIT